MSSRPRPLPHGGARPALHLAGVCAALASVALLSACTVVQPTPVVYSPPPMAAAPAVGLVAHAGWPAVLSGSTRTTRSRFGPWAPSSSFWAMSPVRDGPVMKLSERGRGEASSR